MKINRWILPACLIFIGLVVTIICIVHYSSCISESDAVRIAADYMKANSLASQDGNLELQQSLLTSDLIRLISGDQEWILWMAEPEDYGNWLFIDAHAGFVKEVRQGFQEWWTPIAIPGLRNTLSYLPAAFYVLAVLFSFFYWKKKTYRILLWAFLALSCGYVALYYVGAVLLMVLLLLVA